MMSDDEAKKVGQLYLILIGWGVFVLFFLPSICIIKRSIDECFEEWTAIEKEWIESMESISSAKSMEIALRNVLEPTGLEFVKKLTFNLTVSIPIWSIFIVSSLNIRTTILT